MANLIEEYNDYLCELLSQGYVRMIIKHTQANNNIVTNICQLCAMFTSIPCTMPITNTSIITNTTTNNNNNGTIFDKTEYWMMTHLTTHKRRTLQQLFMPPNIRNVAWMRHNFLGCDQLYNKNEWDLDFIKNESLSRSIYICCVWAYLLQSHFAEYNSLISEDVKQNMRYSKKDILVKVINAFIEISERMICIKYKYIPQLLAMYEFYYFDLYVLKIMKEKLKKQHVKQVQKTKI